MTGQLIEIFKGIAKMDKPDVVRISEELERMPELARVDRIKLHSQSFFIFERNADELRRILTFHADTQRDFTLWSQDNYDKLLALQREVGRLLHNFAAAASSLIDVTRRLYEEYEEGTLPEYQPKINAEFRDDPLAQFIVGLRQYVVHYAAPPIASELSFQIGNDIASQIYLPSEVLLNYSGWKKSAKSYITSYGEKINLGSVVESYFAKVKDFHDWFYQRLNDIHEDDLGLIRSKTEELRKAYYQDVIGRLGFYIQGFYRDGGTPDNILKNILAPDDKAEIFAISEPEARVAAAIKLISKYAEIHPVFVEQLQCAFTNDNRGIVNNTISQ